MLNHSSPSRHKLGATVQSLEQQLCASSRRQADLGERIQHLETTINRLMTPARSSTKHRASDMDDAFGSLSSILQMPSDGATWASTDLNGDESTDTPESGTLSQPGSLPSMEALQSALSLPPGSIERQCMITSLQQAHMLLLEYAAVLHALLPLGQSLSGLAQPNHPDSWAGTGANVEQAAAAACLLRTHADALGQLLDQCPLRIGVSEHQAWDAPREADTLPLVPTTRNSTVGPQRREVRLVGSASPLRQGTAGIHSLPGHGSRAASASPGRRGTAPLPSMRHLTRSMSHASINAAALLTGSRMSGELCDGVETLRVAHELLLRQAGALAQHASPGCSRTGAVLRLLRSHRVRLHKQMSAPSTRPPLPREGRQLADATLRLQPRSALAGQALPAGSGGFPHQQQGRRHRPHRPPAGTPQYPQTRSTPSNLESAAGDYRGPPLGSQPAEGTAPPASPPGQHRRVRPHGALSTDARLPTDAPQPQQLQGQKTRKTVLHAGDALAAEAAHSAEMVVGSGPAPTEAPAPEDAEPDPVPAEPAENGTACVLSAAARRSRNRPALPNQGGPEELAELHAAGLELLRQRREAEAELWASGDPNVQLFVPHRHIDPLYKTVEDLLRCKKPAAVVATTLRMWTPKGELAPPPADADGNNVRVRLAVGDANELRAEVHSLDVSGLNAWDDDPSVPADLWDSSPMHVVRDDVPSEAVLARDTQLRHAFHAPCADMGRCGVLWDGELTVDKGGVWPMLPADVIARDVALPGQLATAEARQREWAASGGEMPPARRDQRRKELEAYFDRYRLHDRTNWDPLRERPLCTERKGCGLYQRWKEAMDRAAATGDVGAPCVRVFTKEDAALVRASHDAADKEVESMLVAIGEKLVSWGSKSPGGSIRATRAGGSGGVVDKDSTPAQAARHRVSAKGIVRAQQKELGALAADLHEAVERLRLSVGVVPRAAASAAG
eukprot:jgi/Tetstr1/459701/TSEL_005054.t1